MEAGFQRGIIYDGTRRRPVSNDPCGRYRFEALIINWNSRVVGPINARSNVKASKNE